jgi:hypothetical protein
MQSSKRRTVARIVLVGVAAAGIVYLAIGVGVIRAIVRSPGAVPPRTPEHRIIMRRFVWAVVAEVVGSWWPIPFAPSQSTWKP